MRIITIILPLLLLAGCEGHYRYPCQDPANWGKLECNNDVCKAEGTCTNDVLAPAGTRDLEQNTETETESSTEVSTEDGETEISSIGCTEPKKLSYSEGDDRVFNVKNKMMAPPSGNEEIERDVTGEEPVTMKSEVDAIEHDKAVE